MSRSASSSSPHRRQGGQGLLAVVLLLVVGASAFIFTFVSPAKITIDQDKQTALALQQALDALIGYAAGDANRPGSLPCPDNNNDGISETVIPTDCAGYIVGSNVYIGRLPWRSLRLPDPRDGSGERLWYAVSREFARNPNCAPGCPLNSDSPGQLTVTGPGAGANVIAIVFSPGAPILGQVRNTANENNVANYLDGAENTNGDSTFTTALASANFNDRLLLVTRDNLFPTVEKRVARELRQSLITFYNNPANQYYPHAMPFDGSTSLLNFLTRGRIPTQTCTGIFPHPGLLPNPVPLPGWVVPNNWHEVMVYTVAPACTPLVTVTFPWGIFSPRPASTCYRTCTGSFFFWSCTDAALAVGSANCNNVGPLITVTGVANNIRALILPGSYRFPAQPNPRNVASRLLEDAQNHDNDGADNSVYVVPQRSPANNDQLVIVDPPNP